MSPEGEVRARRLLDLAVFESHHGRHGAAERAAEDSAKEHPSDEADQLYLDTLRAQGKLERWARVRVEALADSVHGDEVLFQYREMVDVLASESSSGAPAFELLLTIAERFWSEPWVLGQLEELAQRTGRWSEYVRVLREVMAQNETGETVSIAVRLAAVLGGQLRQFDDAQAILREALSSQPDDPQALDLMIDLLHREDELLAVVPYIETRLRGKVEPNRASTLWGILADFHLRADRIDEANHAYRAQLRTGVDPAGVTNALAAGLRRAQDWEGLVELWRDTLGRSARGG